MSIIQLPKASLYGKLNIFTVNFNNDLYENSDDKLFRNHFNENYNLLENFSQQEIFLLNSQLKIYFVQTSDNEDILSRHACSIEAAARLHPYGLIFVFMRSKYIHKKKGSFNRLQSYTNIRFVHFNEHEVYSSTTLSRLNETKRRQFMRYYAISHMSDFVRTALLYKYGGIYFDLDVIPLKNFTYLTNTVGLEFIDGVNVAVLAFERQHLALDIQMNIQLISVNKRLNTFCWNCLGPSALSDALKRVCDHNQLHINSKDKCHQIDIQPSFVFYPIASQQILQFFRQSKSSNEIDYLLKNASIYSIHYFHHMTMNLPIEKSSPFARIAQIYCPNVYEKLIDSEEFHSKKSSISNYFFTHLSIPLFCLSILLLSVLLLLLLSAITFLTYFTLRRVIILALQHTSNARLRTRSALSHKSAVSGC